MIVLEIVYVHLPTRLRMFVWLKDRMTTASDMKLDILSKSVVAGSIIFMATECSFVAAPASATEIVFNFPRWTVPNAPFPIGFESIIN